MQHSQIKAVNNMVENNSKAEKQIKICIKDEMKKCIITTCLFVHCDKNAKIDDKFAKCIIINISI